MKTINYLHNDSSTISYDLSNPNNYYKILQATKQQQKYSLKLHLLPTFPLTCHLQRQLSMNFSFMASLS